MIVRVSNLEETLDKMTTELQSCRSDKLKCDYVNNELSDKLNVAIAENRAIKSETKQLAFKATELENELTDLKEKFSKCESDKKSAFDMLHGVAIDNEKILEENIVSTFEQESMQSEIIELKQRLAENDNEITDLHQLLSA